MDTVVTDLSTIGIIATIIGAVVAASWALHTQLTGISTMLQVHIAQDASKFEELYARLAKIEKRRPAK